jgi:hypothetical protein
MVGRFLKIFKKWRRESEDVDVAVVSEMDNLEKLKWKLSIIKNYLHKCINGFLLLKMLKIGMLIVWRVRL